MRTGCVCREQRSLAPGQLLRAADGPVLALGLVVPAVLGGGPVDAEHASRRGDELAWADVSGACLMFTRST